MQSNIYETLSRDTVAVAESLSVMINKEQAIYRISDYLLPLVSSSCSSSAITESDRTQIVDWCYSVVDLVEFERETVMVAMGIVDRFLSKPSSSTTYFLQDRVQFQLLSLTALYIAIKTNELQAFGSDLVAAVSNGLYSVKDVEAMELTILQGLEWRIFAPTSIQLAHQILSLLLPHVRLEESMWYYILDEVRYQAKNALRDYHLSIERPSTVAMAAILNSLDRVVDSQDLQAILRTLLTIIKNGDFASTGRILSASVRLQRVITEDAAFQSETLVDMERVAVAGRAA